MQRELFLLVNVMRILQHVLWVGKLAAEKKSYFKTWFCLGCVLNFCMHALVKPLLNRNAFKTFE